MLDAFDANEMSLEDHLTSLYELPKSRLSAVPRHVYYSRSEMEDSDCKTFGSQPVGNVQFWQQLQKDEFHMFQTQECSHKFSSTCLSSQTLPHHHAATPSSPTVKDAGHHVRPASSRTTGRRKVKSFSAFSASADARENSSCCVDGSPALHHERTRNQKSNTSTLQANSIMIPSTAGNVVVQPEKIIDRRGITISRTESARQVRVDDSPKNKELPYGTFSRVNNSCNDDAVKQQYYIYSSKSQNNNNNNNNNNFLHQPEFTAVQVTDHSFHRPVSQRKVESGKVAPSLHSGGSIRRIPVAVTVHNGSIKRSQIAATPELSSPVHMLSAFTVAASDNTDSGRTSGSVTPDLQPDTAAVVLRQRIDNVSSNAEHLLTHSCEEDRTVKIEKRMISNTPMAICTMPVRKPAFVCKPLLVATSTSSTPGFGHSSTVPRSYHETTRLHRHENLPATENGHGVAGWKSAASASKIPYVGADLWELSTQRLQRAIIDKVIHGPVGAEEMRDVDESMTVYGGAISEASRSNSPATNSPVTSSCSPRSIDQSLHGDGSRLVMSAKTVRPRTEPAVRGSQSTSRLRQTSSEEDEDDAAVDCDTEQ